MPGSELCKVCKAVIMWEDDDGKPMCMPCHREYLNYKGFLIAYKKLCKKYHLEITSCNCCDGTSLDPLQGDINREIKHLTDRYLRETAEERP